MQQAIFTFFLFFRLELKKRSVNESLYKERKVRIQTSLKDEMGILVDVVKQGVGTTNCGNASRRFFSDATTASRITGIDKSLIERFSFILDALSSLQDLDFENFKVYAAETANLYNKLYPWYYMPASVHLVLYHGADIMATLELPIGSFSEEALESRNKNIRKFRYVRIFHYDDN